MLPGSLYNYLYGELVTNYLVNLNDFVEYRVDTESAVTYTDSDGEEVTVPKVQVPFLFLYNRDNTDADGNPAPIVAGLELMKVRDDFVTDNVENAEAVDEYKASSAASAVRIISGLPIMRKRSRRSSHRTNRLIFSRLPIGS